MSGFKPWFIACVRSQFDLSANFTIRAIARVSSNRKTAKLTAKLPNLRTSLLKTFILPVLIMMLGYLPLEKKTGLLV